MIAKIECRHAPRCWTMFGVFRRTLLLEPWTLTSSDYVRSSKRLVITSRPCGELAIGLSKALKRPFRETGDSRQTLLPILGDGHRFHDHFLRICPSRSRG